MMSSWIDFFVEQSWFRWLFETHWVVFVAFWAGLPLLVAFAASKHSDRILLWIPGMLCASWTGLFAIGMMSDAEFWRWEFERFGSQHYGLMLGLFFYGWLILFAAQCVVSAAYVVQGGFERQRAAAQGGT